MTEPLLLALAQLNPVVGDIAGNVARLMAAWRQAQRSGATLLVTSELFLTGYAPDDFILKPRLRKVIREAVDALARETASGPAVLLGTPWAVDDQLYNAALLLDGGKIAGLVFKSDLPNYGPFDEKRLFTAGAEAEPIICRDHRLGVLLCEDMWQPEVTRELTQKGAELLISMNGSPFQVGRQHKRYSVARERVRESGLSLVYVNQVGGQDEMVYEGASFAMDPHGQIKHQAKSWEEEVAIVGGAMIERKWTPAHAPLADVPEGEASVYQALMIGLRDYVAKNGFQSIILGLSGGIDSALVATLAVDTLGAANVRTVMMPSPYTSRESIEDAAAVSKALGCRMDTVRIDEAMTAIDHILAEQFIGCQPDVTEENIQARLRGVALMALSNKSGSMVLATGNKSEIAVGYSTLYGDSCGGFAPLKDVYKTEVYKLARWRNANLPAHALGASGAVIPERILTKAPTAELKPGQKDQDTLPPYETLDDILRCLIEQDLGVAETTMMGHDAATVRRVYTMLDRAEYKRRQMPPGPRVTRRHITKDRRYPITNRYSDKWSTHQSD
ncbi:MAG TPA: NAD+ synthase [Rhodospirillaceae bacterium]|nr:NAD+ synthase [Rhodospirillaceae bacterium]